MSNVDDNIKLGKVIIKLENDFDTIKLERYGLKIGNIANLLHSNIVIAMAYKLCSPGLFTVQDIMSLTGRISESVEAYIRKLVDLDVIITATKGIYVRGKHGKLLMTMFEWMAIEAYPNILDEVDLT